MSRTDFRDPQKNLVLIIRESGLTQSNIAQKIAERGYSVARATINRWANPQKRNRSFSYNPLIMQALLEVCGENIVTGLKLEDLFSDEDVLAAKLRTKKSSGEMLPGILSSAARDLTARKYDDKLAGRYVADIPINFLGHQAVHTVFDIANAGDVKFSVGCAFSISGDQSGFDEPAPRGSGQMVIWERSAIILVEADLESLTLITILISLPSHRASIDVLEGAITVSGGRTGNAPVVGQIVMKRLADSDVKAA